MFAGRPRLGLVGGGALSQPSRRKRAISRKPRRVPRAQLDSLSASDALQALLVSHSPPRGGNFGDVRDSDVRPALVAAVARRVGDQPHLLVPEVPVHWTVPARMDALLVADRISGFEIKSDVDSLTRLPRQIEAYGAVVERAVLVVGDRHLAAGKRAVPPWWAIWGARWHDDEVVFREVRRGRLNPNLNPLAVATFMTRDDLVHALRERGFTRLSTYRVDVLRQLLANNVSTRDTIRLARQAMLGNALWRHRSLLAS